MKMARIGGDPSRRASPMKILAAALAMAFLPLGAAAQEPEAAPAVEAPLPGLEEMAAPEADAAAPAEAVAAEPEMEEVENPFTVQHMWEQGDIVARSTLIIMILMFSGTVYIGATKAIDQTVLIGQVKKINGFWEAATIDDGLAALGEKSAFRSIAEGAIAQANSAQSGLGARISRADRTSHQVGIELERVNGRLQAGMAFLATVGAICPFVGLFGTVWGIVNALVRIGLSGDASIEKVAGPVGEALIMTAIGLGVAVPAVILYNLLGRRNKNISDAARHFAFDLEKLMATSAKA
jgi:biopolymer transport protein ExbB